MGIASDLTGLAIIASDYVGVLTELSPRAHTAVALGIIAALGVFNYVGMKWASLFQKVTTVIKVGFLALFAAVGVALMSGVPNLLGTRLTPTTGLSPTGNVIAALMLIIRRAPAVRPHRERLPRLLHPRFPRPAAPRHDQGQAAGPEQQQPDRRQRLLPGRELGEQLRFLEPHRDQGRRPLGHDLVAGPCAWRGPVIHFTNPPPNLSSLPEIQSDVLETTSRRRAHSWKAMMRGKKCRRLKVAVQKNVQ